MTSNNISTRERKEKRRGMKKEGKDERGLIEIIKQREMFFFRKMGEDGQ